MDNTSGRCVATLRKQHFDEDLFAEQLYCLGKYYNNALIAVEINYSRHPVNILCELGYENLYRGKQGSSNETTIGFYTTSVNRPIIISNLVSIMRDNLMLETDRETLSELCTFIKHSDGKSAAASGSHDDLVMSSAIAHHVGLNYEHNIQIIDTGSDILESCFNSQVEEENEYMEW